jgi:HEPN domain-containing protein
LARRSREDLDALVALHELAGIADSVIGFHAQQAVEKALKAAIVNSGGGLHRTHDLRFLVQQARGLTIVLPEEVARAHWLTPWAVELRYGEYLEEPLDRVLAVQAATAAVAIAERLVAPHQ